MRYVWIFSVWLVLLTSMSAFSNSDLMVREGTFITSQSDTIWYKTMGKSGTTPLILLHGGPGMPSDYLNPLSVLAEDRMLVFFDQAGCGKSGKIKDLSKLNIPYYVQQLEELRSFLNIETFYLYGQSWGSMLGIEYYFTHPEHVKALILSSPCLNTSIWLEDTRILIRNLSVRIQENINLHEQNQTYEHPDYQEAVQCFYQAYVARKLPWSEDMMNALDKFGAEVYNYMWGPSEFRCTGMLQSFDCTSRLKEVSIPVLYIAGEFDEARPETVIKFKQLTPVSEFAMIPGAAHATMHDNPEEDVRVIRQFLQKRFSD